MDARCATVLSTPFDGLLCRQGIRLTSILWLTNRLSLNLDDPSP